MKYAAFAAEWRAHVMSGEALHRVFTERKYVIRRNGGAGVMIFELAARGHDPVRFVLVGPHGPDLTTEELSKIVALRVQIDRWVGGFRDELPTQADFEAMS